MRFKLLACPFCLGDPRMDMDKPGGSPRWVVSCTKCGGEGGPGRTADEARNLWENCAAPPRLRAEMLATAAEWSEDARRAKAECDRPVVDLCERAAQQLTEFVARFDEQRVFVDTPARPRRKRARR